MDPSGDLNSTASAMGTAGVSHSFGKAGDSNDGFTGFSHSAFHLNNQPMAGYGHRHPRRTNISTINTGTAPSNLNENASPATAFDMQFTPLLPSQLLLGSPFQPGSPSTFASPQFSTFGAFPQPNNSAHQTRQSPVGNSVTGQNHPLSPQVFPNFIPQAGLGAQQVLAPGSPITAYPGLAGQGMSMPQGPFMPGLYNGTSRTVYLGNIPPETSAEEILGHVRSGQIESVRLLPDKNCAFISFLEGGSATHFHSDAILKKLSIRGHDIKVGWGKPSHVPTSVAIAVQQSGASRNVYLGNIPDGITEQDIREDLGKFGPIDTVKIVREKAIAFVHFLSISNAIKAVSHLPQETKWQPPRRVYYGKDRCAYVSKTQQQNAAQYLGIPPGYAHILNGADRDLISNAIAQQSVAAAAVATSAGGINNLGNRTVYLGNIHPETTVEEICNVVRGGLLHHIRYIPDKHICFVTFIDPTSAASFYALSNLQGLMIHNRRLKIGWGKHSGALPPAIALAVSGGASRNVYIGNLDESWSEDRLRQDFSDYGEIELVNALREKSCAFVNFTNIANAIKAIEGIRGREDYRRFKINFGKDRCGNPPRQVAHNNQKHHNSPPNGIDSLSSPQAFAGGVQLSISRAGSANSPTRSALSPPPGSAGGTSNNSQQHALGPAPAAVLNAGDNNPLTMYLSQLSIQQTQQTQQSQHLQDSYGANAQMQQQNQLLTAGQGGSYGGAGGDLVGSAALEAAHRQGSTGLNGFASSNATVGGLLAPSNANLASARGQHARAISLPVFFNEPTAQNGGQQQQQKVTSGLGGFGGNGYGLAIQAGTGLSGWAEEEIPAQ